jgi:type IV pilus assembly protein PilO
MGKERFAVLVKGIAPRYLVALYLVLVLALGVLGSSLLLYPQEARINAIASQVQAERQKVVVVENFVLAHPDADKRLLDLQQSLVKVEKALPGSLDVSVFMSQLERDAIATGVRLVQIRPSALADRAGYREMPIEVSVEGTYYATLAFLKKLEDGERFSLPTAFLIQRKQDKLLTRLNLQIFCYGVTPRPTAVTPSPGQPAAIPPAR